MDMIQGRMDLAVEYGADVAIFVHNIVFWVRKNAANRENYHEGRYWTYNSMRALCEIYPLWSRDQLKRIIKKSEEAGLILTGNFNKKPMDRTIWYSPSDRVLALYELAFSPPIGRNRPMDDAEPPNASGETAPAIPSIYPLDTQVPPYNPPKGDGESKPKRSRRSSEPKEAPDWKPDRFQAFWDAYPRGESKQAAIKAWDKLKPDDALLVTMAKGLKQAMASEDWQRGIGIPYASTWINQRKWTDEARAPIPAQRQEVTYGVR